MWKGTLDKLSDVVVMLSLARERETQREIKRGSVRYFITKFTSERKKKSLRTQRNK